MRGLKVRSADTLHDWSVALLADASVGGLRAYMDAQSLLKLSLNGGVMTGPLLLAGDAVNPYGAVPLSQVQSLISTAVNALIGSAPGTLDTLQEIAAALNNNPNAIAAITTQLTDKASLTTGAVFTGPVSVPTVANGDNSNAAASTAWVLANTQAGNSNANGAEDTWLGDGVRTTFNFVNIDGALVSIRQKRLLVFVDGNRQSTSAYSVGSAGITFTVPPTATMEIEALHIE